MKIQYKNTLNQTKIRISQNLMFKNNNNIIFRQFENILYIEIFKCLVRFGSQNSELVATLPFNNLLYEKMNCQSFGAEVV